MTEFMLTAAEKIALYEALQAVQVPPDRRGTAERVGVQIRLDSVDHGGGVFTTTDGLVKFEAADLEWIDRVVAGSSFAFRHIENGSVAKLEAAVKKALLNGSAPKP